jgi:flagellar hook-associated protein 3 FlgL
MIFDAGVSGINRQTASLLHVQQQVASERRILTPSDDPVAAARALEVTQLSDVVDQGLRNQGYATSALGLEEVQIESVSDVLARVRELTVGANTASLTASARKNIATELRSRFTELLGMANTADGTGQHMFAGFMGAVTPFGGSVDNILAGNEIVYQGDDGQRTMQVSPGHFIEVSDSGNDVFKRIKNGNGYFTADYAAANTGTGIVASGSVTDPAAWNASATKDVTINFTVTAGVTTYDLVDTSSGISLLTGAAGPAPLANQRAYQSGQPIVLKSQGAEAAFDLGASTSVSGTPASGDSFSLAPSASQSIFKTLANLIGALEAPTGTAAADAKYLNEIGFALTNIDQGYDNIIRVREQIGSRLSEIDSLGSLGGSLKLQYQQNLSDLQDLDYAKAISELTRKKTDLEAAQQSFAKISQLSLFNYL